MNCANHIEVPAAAFCRACGKALCASCTRDVRGVVYCEECIAARLNDPAVAAAPPYTPAAAVNFDSGASPGLAAVLGFIPGVGAMYNGQFGKGFLHVMIFASLIWVTEHGFDIMGLGIAAWLFYMVFDAYKTAKARKYGLPVPDPLGINNIFASQEAKFNTVRAPSMGYQPGAPSVSPVEEVAPAAAVASGVPIGAIVLIVIGCLFLLNTMGVFDLHWLGRLWPLILIVLGVAKLIQRGYIARR
jgi:TM2 domain-containing membrane protein YozV